MSTYVWPTKDRWQSCRHEEKLIWTLRLIQQEFAGDKRQHQAELSEHLQELIVLADFAIEDA